MSRAPGPAAAPAAIYQDFLDRMSLALWQEDWATLEASMTYPSEVGAFDNVVALEGPGDTRRFAADYRENMREAGATAYLRVVQDARMVERGRIEGTHCVYVLRGAEHVVEPFVSEMTLVQAPDGTWRASAIISRARARDNRINVGNPPLRDADT